MHRVLAFDCYTHADHPRRAVRDGPCWMAFLLGPLWMIHERLWGWFALWVGIYIALSLVSAMTVFITHPLGEIAATMGFAAAYMGLAIIPLLYGNRWVGARLERQGYVWCGQVMAENAPAAVREGPGGGNR